ncbi:MAG: hypothetical protein MUF62_06790 [Chitinophagaceae bacterium]|jgi:tetratricopeptide (TPR) repeat protein|nr:hypothetical protein [Chitinophagaceae bacterium]
MFFKKDLYKALRPIPDDSYIGLAFKKMVSINYSDALVYPRFKFLHFDKPYLENGIFETSDYKKLIETIGNPTLKIGAFISFNNENYEIKDIRVEVLDIVIDYSNGHTNYYIGNPVPFNIEIHIKVKKIEYFEIAQDFTNKYLLLAKKLITTAQERGEMIVLKNEARRVLNDMMLNIESQYTDTKSLIDFYYYYAIFLSVCKEHLEAINLMSKAINIDPLNADFYLFVGHEYRMLEDYQMSLEYLKKSVSLGSNTASDYIESNF